MGTRRIVHALLVVALAWTAVLAGWPPAPAGSDEPVAWPLVARALPDGTTAVVELLDNGGCRLSAGTGSTAWSAQLGGACSPVIAHDLDSNLYAVGSADDGSAVDIRSYSTLGALRWTSPLPARTQVRDIEVGADGEVLLLTAEGGWGTVRNLRARSGELLGEPRFLGWYPEHLEAADDGYVVIVNNGAFNRGYYALWFAYTGRVLGDHFLGNGGSALTGMTDDGQLVALLSSGSSFWYCPSTLGVIWVDGPRAQARTRPFEGPSSCGSRSLAVGADGTAVVNVDPIDGSVGAALTAFAPDGSLRWTRSGSHPGSSHPARSMAVDDEGRVVAAEDSSIPCGDTTCSAVAVTYLSLATGTPIRSADLVTGPAPNGALGHSLAIGPGGVRALVRTAAGTEVRFIHTTVGHDVEEGPVLRPDPTRNDIDLVALGDSYSSGEGSPHSLATGGSSGNRCHRAPTSFARLLSDQLAAQGRAGRQVHVACSGATIETITDERQYPIDPDLDDVGGAGSVQLDAVDADTDVVTVTAAGNDLGFAGILAYCVTAPDCRTRLDAGDGTRNAIRGVWTPARDLYRAIRERAAPNALVLVVGYPRFFASDLPSCPDIAGLSADEQSWINARIDDLNTVLADAAWAAGATFVDVADVLQVADRTVCSENPAFNGLTAGLIDIQYPFHPNVTGHQLLYERILPHLGAFTSWCPNPDGPVDDCATRSTPEPTGPPVRVGDVRLEGLRGVADRVLEAVSPGGLFRVVLRGLTPGLSLRLRLFSDPVELGTFTADPDGVAEATVTLPEAVPPGVHTLLVEGTGDDAPSSISAQMILVEDNPAPPSGAVAHVADDEVTIAWEPVPGTADEVTYLVTATSPGRDTVEVESDPGATSVVLVGLERRVGYQVAVRTVGRSGHSAPATVERLVHLGGRSVPPADFDGNGTTDIAIFRPSEGSWLVEGRSPVYFGLPSDIPVPGDYDGNGTTDIAIFRPSEGSWYVEGQPTTFWGLSGDIPVPGDYDGNGTTDIAIFRPDVGGWYVRGDAPTFWGLATDVPVPADYDGDGDTDTMVWRPEVGGWYVEGQPTTFWGLSGDIPVPGDYDGNGTTDIAIFRPDVGGWYGPSRPTTFWGLASDIPLQLPYAIGRA